ncbi:Tetratricopeptide repeat protein 27 [Acropora cervicornis]|uniref:Tetratricopeptide repeat protein 27 n=1 Tax=Acropora cervicornis TaxID=6130 RepID=A0AAD9PSA0_ACRCE|nr:Tetratricopeptide repeat protein 27 [Acropora cervicornis]
MADLCEMVFGLEVSVLEREKKNILSSLAAIDQEIVESGEFEELKDTVTCLCKGDYFTALKGKTSQHLLHLAAASTGDFNVINEIALVLKCAKTNSPQIIRHALVLFIGVACLELFIQLNWTGPSDPQHGMGILPGCNQETSDELILQRLSEDGQEHFNAAQSIVGLRVELTGALGRRTKFQQQDVSQLVLFLQREANSDVALNDDTLLAKVKFKDENIQHHINETDVDISPLDQAVILGLTVECQKRQATHTLNTEELLAYLEAITNHPKAWCLSMVALLMRSRLEKDSTRKMERSMMQLQELFDSIENHYPERDLAKLLFQMGAVKSALDIFHQIHAWEDVVYCYQSLGWHAKEDVWFSLGCAAIAANDLEVAAKAFHRCVSLDSWNAEAWNNLSHIYIKKGQKSRAYLTLKESLKGNYESWHIWENFLVVCVDVGAFRDAIIAYDRLMDLRDKYCDVQILGILVRAVNQGLLDLKEKSASDLRPNLLKLMGRQTSQVYLFSL